MVDKKIRIKLIITFIVLLLAIILAIYFYNSYNNTHYSIAKVISNNSNDNGTTNYFIYNDKIYYYRYDKSMFNKVYALYKMNFDGKENEKIIETEELKNATFKFAYKNIAYYQKENNEKITIDLTSGDINKLNTEGNFMLYTFHNGVINTIKEDKEEISIRQIDYKNNFVLYNVKNNAKNSFKDYYLNYDNGDIYYLDKSSKYPILFKNKGMAYSFSANDTISFNNLKVIAIYKEYIYLSQNNNIYKLNTNKNSIEKIENKIKNLEKIISGISSDNYFYSNNKIYSLNFKTDKFELVVNNISFKPTKLIHLNNRIIFIDDDTKINNIAIYNVSTNTIINEYKDITNLSFDEKYIYIMTKEITTDTTIENNYKIEKIDL